MNVFLLWHTHKSDEGEEYDDDKLVGVYATREKAAASLRRALTLPGFRDQPSGFCIAEYTLDQDHWTEGFGIEWPPEESSGE